MRDVLAQMGGVQSMARELGVSESQAAAGAAALIPAQEAGAGAAVRPRGDLNGDVNPLDDILGMAGKLMR